MPNLFARAASSLLGQRPEESWGPHVRPLLEALEYAAATDVGCRQTAALKRATAPGS